VLLQALNLHSKFLFCFAELLL
jgi:hypothetical protein